METLNNLFSGAWRRFKTHFWTLIWIFAVPLALLLVGQVLTAQGRSPLYRGLSSVRTGPEIATGVVLMIVGVIIAIMAGVAVINALAHKTNFAASYSRGAQLFWPMIWISILNSVAVLGALVLFVIPGIYLYFVLIFSSYVLVTENKHGLHALKKSRDYVRGNWWAVFLRVILILIILFVVMALIVSPITMLGGPVAGLVAYFVVLVLFAAFYVSYLFEIFENLRKIKTGGASMTTATGGAAAVPTEPARGWDFLNVTLTIGVAAVIVYVYLIFLIASRVR